jgi:hypothetical protein
VLLQAAAEAAVAAGCASCSAAAAASWLVIILQHSIQPSRQKQLK